MKIFLITQFCEKDGNRTLNWLNNQSNAFSGIDAKCYAILNDFTVTKVIFGYRSRLMPA